MSMGPDIIFLKFEDDLCLLLLAVLHLSEGLDCAQGSGVQGRGGTLLLGMENKSFQRSAVLGLDDLFPSAREGH